MRMITLVLAESLGQVTLRAALSKPGSVDTDEPGVYTLVIAHDGLPVQAHDLSNRDNLFRAVSGMFHLFYSELDCPHGDYLFCKLSHEGYLGVEEGAGQTTA